MNDKFLHELIQFHFVEKKDRILVAVSGGSDSMFLLHHLLRLRKPLELDLLVAHYNHGLRKSADADETFVKDFCSRNNIPIVIEQGNMKQYAQQHRLSSEEAGRILRYDFFHRIANGRKIFTAHNQKDQAETILLRIFRGTGIDGLCGIPTQNGDIYRPMLTLSKAEILSFFKEEKLTYCVDETNQTLDYQRNRVRNELLPYLEREFNPQIEEALLRLQQIAKDAREIIDYSAEKVKVREWNALCWKKLMQYSEAMQREIIRRAYLQQFPEQTPLSYERIEEIRLLGHKETGKQIDLGNGIIARKSYGQIYLEKEIPHSKEQSEFFLTEGENHTPWGEFQVNLGNIFPRGNRYAIAVDPQQIKGQLYLRYRRAGDRFMPFGMSHYKKLKDYLIDEKIDRKLRDRIPLLCDEEEIIWVVGYRMSERYRVKQKEKKWIIVEAKYVYD